MPHRPSSAARRAAVGAVLLVAFASACVTPPDESGKPAPLRAGAGERFLDMQVGHPHAGFTQSTVLGERHPPDDPGSPFAQIFPATRSLESPITAKAVVLDNGRHRLVLARVDAIFTTAELYRRVLDFAQEELGEDLRGKLILNATHTHSAPGRISLRSIAPDLNLPVPDNAREALHHGADTFSQETTDRFARGIVGAIADAQARLRPARFGWAVGTNDVIQSDRRCTNDHLYGPDDYDTDVVVLRLDDAETDEPMAVLFHHSFHPTVYKQTSRHLSADVVGHAEYAVEARFSRPVVTMFLQGAAGGVGTHQDASGHAGSQAMERLASHLADTVLQTYGEIRTEREVSLQSADRFAPLDRNALGYAAGEFDYEDGAVLCHYLISDQCLTAPLEKDKVFCLGAGKPDQGKKFTHVTAARIADLALLTLPGEPLPEVGKELDRRARREGFAKGVVLGYSQDHNGYILFEEDWLSAGYEPTISFWGWKFGQYIVSQSVDLLRHATTGAAPTLPVTGEPEIEVLPYVPVEPSPSHAEPQVVTDLPGEVTRLKSVRLTFYGGDPALGSPVVTLERAGEDGAFSPYLRSGWIPVTNTRGGDLPLFYEGTPTWREAPEVRVRQHRWQAVFEARHDQPLGTYRLAVRGRARRGGEDVAYELFSSPVELRPAPMRVQAAHRVSDGRLSVHAVLLYPANEAVMGGKEHESWQQANFRMIDPRFGPKFVPVTAGGAALAAASIEGEAQAPMALELGFVPRPVTELIARPYEPGAGSGFFAEVELPAGARRVRIPAGALGDAFGNVNASEVVLDVGG